MSPAAPTSSCAILEAVGEPMAAAFLAHADKPPLLRFCYALKRYYETCPLPAYKGESLYPCGEPFYAGSELIQFHYSAGMIFGREALAQRIHAETRPEIRRALLEFQRAIANYPAVRGYTHSLPHYGRVLREGLNGYRTRIENYLAQKTDTHTPAGANTPLASFVPERGSRAFVEAPAPLSRNDFYQAMLILLDGIAALHKRMSEYLQGFDAPSAQQLASAFARVPFAPAQSFYEALVAYNFLFYLDGCDNLGRLDQELWPYYQQDKAAGRLTTQQALAWIGQLFQNVDDANAWNCAIGGTAKDGSEGSNELTLLCLQAARGRRRPNLALRLRRDTPEEIWQQAFETIAAGTGLPALYNEEEYLRALRTIPLGVRPEDMPYFAFGGCTELMIHGCSNVGSLDDTFNLALCFEQSLHRHLLHCPTFADFMARLKEDIRRDIAALCANVNADQQTKALWQPQPVRTLLVDDCLDKAQEFNAGGARYNWSVICIAGLANTYDSLAAIKQMIYDTKALSAEQLLQALRDNFVGHEPLRRRLQCCPHFGNNNPYVDDIAADVATFVFTEFLKHTPWRGGRFLASCLMFVTYGILGAQVGATPDGRLAYTPLADSAGAVQGRDISGPTALLRSVTRLPHYLAPGTLVVNIRFTKRLFEDKALRQQLKALIRTYFDLGGMQLQINVVDQRLLREALENPEAYRDLIIRVGGYSEYFHRLSRDLQLSILERVEHEGA